MSELCTLLSVVIIGRNEGARLTRCIESVEAMRTGDWAVEVIYVDSGSTDGSVARAGLRGVQTIELNLARPTAAAGRNAGWRAANGEIVLFLDGDTILDPSFVLDSLPEFAESRVAIVWGHRRELDPSQSIYTRALDLDWVYAPGYTPFCGGDALFRRETLAATGGFDETLIAGEEPELCRRILGLGQCILHVDRPMTKHDLAITRFQQYWRRATRAGHAYAEIADRFAATPNPFWSAEVRRTRKRATTLISLVAAGVALSLVFLSLLPIMLVIDLLLLLVARTAWKARWKSSDFVTLVLYGVHSHFQQLPIYAGQRQFSRNQRRGLRAGLVEYKQE